MSRAALLAVLLAITSWPAAAETRITLESPEPYDLQVRGFELPREVEVRIEALGRWDRDGGSWIHRFWGPREDDALTVYAWILDAETRQAVWVMEARDTSRISSTLRAAEAELRLGPGRYELYLFSGYGWVARLDEQSSDPNWWERMFSGRRGEPQELRDDLEQCHVTLSSRDIERQDVGRFEVNGDLPGALVRHNHLGDGAFGVSGFALERPMTLRVYALIEHTKNSPNPADYAWIVDAATREVVWYARETRSRPAGGGSKNWLVDERIALEAGEYLLYYGTDDSHSFQEFNVNPPHDPFNWGVTLLPGEDFDRGAFRTLTPVTHEPPLVEFTQAGDGEFFEQTFRLDTGGQLHVIAVGEYAERADQFVDSAWIIDASTGRPVWEMTRRNTMGAGGADKNRRFDGLVELPRGTYTLYHVTDGTHSYAEWNAAAPFAPALWGVSVRPGPGFDRAGFSLVILAELEDDFLVRLVRAGDDERLRQRFSLESPSRIHIYAIGEGDSGEMYDYAYIVDDRTDRRVWEMDYDLTEHAGGADKNRLVDEELSLEAGTYVAIYVTDGTHSFAGWNARRPRDPLNWGITIRRAQ